MEHVISEHEAIAIVDIEVTKGEVVGGVQRPVSDMRGCRFSSLFAAMLEFI